ncbi:hypothetical protein ACFBBS_001921, partial [Campylobacter coli]
KGVRGLSECVARKTDKAHRPRKKLLNFFCFFSRARTRTRFLYFLYIFLIFRGLSKPYMMGASEILKRQNSTIKTTKFYY